MMKMKKATHTVRDTVWTAFFVFIIDVVPHYFIVSLLLMTDAE